ncbi:MAG: hypothetical protein P8078_11950, partial [bacterium]
MNYNNYNKIWKGKHMQKENMAMSYQKIFRQLCGSILLICMLNVSGAKAQTVVCTPPYLGAGGGQELHILIEETNPTGASQCIISTSPYIITKPRVFGDYTIDNLIIQLNITATGMSVSIQGTVRRTDAGTGGLSVIADGGLAGPYGDAHGDLILYGSTTGTSQTIAGGGALYPVAGLQDQIVQGFPQVIDRVMYEAGTFGGQIKDIPIQPNPVGVHFSTNFHINEVGQSITLPGTAGIGEWETDEPPVSVGFDPSTGGMVITLAGEEDITITKHLVTGGLAINGECTGVLADQVNRLIILGGDWDNSIDLSNMKENDFPGLNSQNGEPRTLVFGKMGDDE